MTEMTNLTLWAVVQPVQVQHNALYNMKIVFHSVFVLTRTYWTIYAQRETFNAFTRHFNKQMIA